MVKGFNPRTTLCEDLQLSWLLDEARRNSKEEFAYFDYLNYKITTNPRRSIDAHLNNIALIDMYDDFDKRKGITDLGWEKLVNEKIYQLSARLRDPYQLFCLKQELKQHGLRYTLKKEKTGAELLVYSKDQVKMKALVNALKNYEITATVLPYKEDQRWKTIK